MEERQAFFGPKIEIEENLPDSKFNSKSLKAGEQVMEGTQELTGMRLQMNFLSPVIDMTFPPNNTAHEEVFLCP